MPSNHYSKDGSYVTGCCLTPDRGWLILAIDEMAKQEIPNSGIFHFENGTLAPVKLAHFKSRFCTCLDHQLSKVFVVGEYGQCAMVALDGTLLEEQIAVDGIEPDERGPLRAGIQINGEVVMVGMDRQVYKRSRGGSWMSMETGLPVLQTDSLSVSGFEAIAGRSITELVAVGWDGEIWIFDGTQWHPVDSPTNRILTSLCVSPDGTYFAGGRNGLLLRGRGRQWEIIHDTNCPDDIWDLIYFDNQLFAASLSRFYRLTDDVFEQVAEIDAFPKSYAKFSANSEGFWSIGAKAVISFCSKTGWQHIA